MTILPKRRLMPTAFHAILLAALALADSAFAQQQEKPALKAAPVGVAVEGAAAPGAARPALTGSFVYDPRARADFQQRQIVRAAAGLAAQAASFEEKQTLYHRLNALPLPKLVRVGGDPEFFTPSYLRPNP